MSGDKPYKDKERLERLYWGDGKTLAEVADVCNCAVHTIQRWMDKHDIDTRDERGSENSGPKPEVDYSAKNYRDESWLRKKYVDEGLNANDIAELEDTGNDTILSWIDKFGIERKSRSEALRKTHADFFIDFKGYRRAQAYDIGKGRPDQIKIHRLAAVAWFGFYTVAGKDIHHKNSHPIDNRESNLEPIEHGEHTRLHNNERYGDG